MTDTADVGALYRAARERLIDLVRTLSADELRMPVPACPRWTVHDVVAHVVGTPADIRAGLVTNLPPSDDDTAATLARHRATPTHELLATWEGAGPGLDEAFTAMGVGIAPAVIDVTTHEQDIRAAVARPGARETSELRQCLAWTDARFLARVSAAGLTPIDARVLAPGFERFRAYLGRRSAAQVATWTWPAGVDHGPYLAELFIFGPSTLDQVE